MPFESPVVSRVLTTGGAGFIGSHLADWWEAQNVQVVTVDDLRAKPLVSIRGSFKEKSVLDMEPDDLDGVDVVYHLASHKSVPESFSQPIEYLENVESVSHLLRLVAEAGTPRVIIASTCEVYGQATVLPSEEGAPLAPRSPYAATKVALEMIARAYQQAADVGVDITLVRFFNVYGPRERPDALVPSFCKSALEDGRLLLEGSGDQRRDFTYISDLIPRLARLASVRSVPTLNLGSGESHSVRDVAQILLELHQGAVVQQMPERQNEIQEFRADVTLARRLLGNGRTRVGLREGIGLTYKWWQDRLRDEVSLRHSEREFVS
ncbi:NAD-dependent epimerase/dehydratase family protein [Streptomyces sp. NPDC007856]|uniref:NAD-dependent epimerase/dehydratase family protein n=1 Tax=Streptomyces sp. NPDC007856 TaxID=3364781 RepID=UPI0036B85CE6